MQPQTACSILLLTIAMTGCASSTTESPRPAAWTAYQKFERELVQSPDDPDYERHLSEEWIAIFNSAGTEDESAELSDYASYPRWLSEAVSHYEKPDQEGRCLLVNGIAFDRTPGTLAVRYLHQDSGLRASEIHYQYWEDEHNYPTEALCPDEFELGHPSS